MVERESNHLLIYHVSDRTKETLLPIVERHIAKGATIYSDGWSAYCKLNEAGYDHFTEKFFISIHLWKSMKSILTELKVIGNTRKIILGNYREQRSPNLRGISQKLFCVQRRRGEMFFGHSLIFCRHCTHCLDQQRAIRIQTHYSTLGRVSQQQVLNLMNRKFVQVLFI